MEAVKSVKSIKVNLNSVESVKRFCEISSKNEFSIDVVSGKYRINGKSLLGLFSLDLSNDIEVEIESSDIEAINIFLKDIQDYIVD